MRKIDELTIGEARELVQLFSGKQLTEECPYHVGENYFIRTVTHHLTGNLVRVTSQELVLVDAAWIADDGRFSDAMRTGKLNEVEPFNTGEVIVGRASIVDACIWKHALPNQQK